MAQVIINESNLTNIAGAIRTKSSSEETFKPSEMAAGVLAIPTQSTGDATATAADILYDKTAYIATGKVTGTIQTKTGDDITSEGGIVTIPAGYYAQQYQKQGDPTGDATMTSGGQMLLGITAYSQGTKYTGTITSKAAATIVPSGSDYTIAAGQYLEGAQTIKGVELNATAATILTGNSVSITSNDTTIVSLAGTCTYDADTSDATAAASDIRSGYTGYVDGSKVTGTAALVYTAATKELTMPDWAVTIG